MPPVQQISSEYAPHPTLQRTLSVYRDSATHHNLLSKQVSTPLCLDVPNHSHGMPPLPSPLLLQTPLDMTSPPPLENSLMARVANLHKRLGRTQSEPVQVTEPRQVTAHSSRYKTEMCRPFEESGFCKYGEKCQFAHGNVDIRTLNRHPKYKTELCKTFHSIGLCPYGPRCHFIHNAEESRVNHPSNQPQNRFSSAPSPISPNMGTVSSLMGLPTILDQASPPGSTLSISPPISSFADEWSNQLLENQLLENHLLGSLADQLSELNLLREGSAHFSPNDSFLQCSSPTGSVSSGENSASFSSEGSFGGDSMMRFSQRSEGYSPSISPPANPIEIDTANQFHRLPIFRSLNHV